MIEKVILIKDLMSFYPYPEEWFKKLKTPQLVAMYSKIKNRPQVKNISKPKDLYRKYENGDYWVYTDINGWEIEIR